MWGQLAQAGVGLAGMLSSLLGGGDNGASDIKAAAEIQAAAARYAANLARRTGLEGVQRLSPWTSGGQNALLTYLDLLGLPRPTIEQLMSGQPLPTKGNVGEQQAWDRQVKMYQDWLGTPKTDPTQFLEQTPGYQFRYQQGQNALDRTAAARGRLLSGSQVKASQQFGQGLAADEYNALLNRIAGVSTGGQNAATGASTINMQGAMAAGQNTMAGAQAEAQGIYNAMNLRNSTYGNQFPAWAGYTAQGLIPMLKNWAWPSSYNYGPGGNAFNATGNMAWGGPSPY